MRVRAIRDHFDGVFRKAGEEFDHVVGKPSKHVEPLEEPEEEPAPSKPAPSKPTAPKKKSGGKVKKIVDKVKQVVEEGADGAGEAIGEAMDQR